MNPRHQVYWMLGNEENEYTAPCRLEDKCFESVELKVAPACEHGWVFAWKRRRSTDVRGSWTFTYNNPTPTRKAESEATSATNPTCRISRG